MGVFEDVVTNAKSAAASVGKEAGRLVDISVLRLDAAELQREISKKYEALGRIVYDSGKSGSSANEGFDQHIENIDMLYRRLDEVNEKIRILRGKSQCPKCGAANDEKSLFCSRCGTRLNTESDSSEAQDKSQNETGTAEPPVQSGNE